MSAPGKAWLAVRKIDPAVWTAVLTGVLALVTFFLWQSTAELVAGEDSATKLEDRAYVSFSWAEIDPLKVGEPIHFDVNFVNTGRTPAQHVSDGIEIARSNYPALRDTSRPQADVARGGSTGPNQSIRNVGDTDFLVTQDFIDDVTARKAVVLIWGEVDYDDVFGAHHTTLLKLVHGGATAPGESDLKKTPDGNDAN